MMEAEKGRGGAAMRANRVIIGSIIGCCVLIAILAGFAIMQTRGSGGPTPPASPAGESGGTPQAPSVSGTPAASDGLLVMPETPEGRPADSSEDKLDGWLVGADGEQAASDSEDNLESPLPPTDDGQETPPPFVKAYNLPDGFVYVDDHIPGVRLDIRYFGENNFVGAPVDGYKGPFAILTKEAADALAKVQEEVRSLGYTLLIYDAYRPQKAVDHFKRWSQDPSDTKTKADHYPDLEKSRLFKMGYIASRSGHSRGSTVDLTLADAATGEPLDMGGPFDFFGEVSHQDTPLITEEQAANRRILKDAMERHGFEAYAKEWWHYTLADEPYPETYFDFDVE